MGPDNYDKMKGYVQELMNQGVIQFTKSKIIEEVSIIEPITIIYRKKQIEVPMNKIQPINIFIPGPFPYRSIKVMPWRYDTTAYVGCKSIQFFEAKIVNIAGTRGMTRSGHVFAPNFSQKILSPTFITLKDKIMPTNPS